MDRVHLLWNGTDRLMGIWDGGPQGVPLFDTTRLGEADDNLTVSAHEGRVVSFEWVFRNFNDDSAVKEEVEYLVQSCLGQLPLMVPTLPPFVFVFEEEPPRWPRPQRRRARPAARVRGGANASTPDSHQVDFPLEWPGPQLTVEDLRRALDGLPSDLPVVSDAIGPWMTWVMGGESRTPAVWCVVDSGGAWGDGVPRAFIIAHALRDIVGER